MPLPLDLFDVTLRYSCRHCGCIVEREGKWFFRLRQYTCSSCKQQVRVSYDDKLKIFARRAVST
jgi:hypothetical protein